MTINRVLLGKYNDGVTIGLRVSLPGADALTGDSSLPGTFSFDSEWTDIAKIHQVSLTARTTHHPPWTSSGVTVDGFAISWSGLGYKPFVETHLYTSSGVIYDDYFPNGPVGGTAAGCRGSIPNVDPNGLYIQGGVSGDQMLSIIYKIQVPVG